ncbi:hypothetical protein CR513_44983, partial [Mucuna pruriens]
MELAIGKPYLFLPTDKDVWKAIHECYSNMENSSQNFYLKTTLASKTGRSRCHNILQLDGDPLARVRPIHAAQFRKREENDHVYMFFTSLNRSIDEVRENIEQNALTLY